METIFNVSAFALVIDNAKPAIAPGASVEVTPELAAELCAGPDWSLTGPKTSERISRKVQTADEATDNTAEADEKKEN